MFNFHSTSLRGGNITFSKKIQVTNTFRILYVAPKP
jgi:hypothetical protein